MQFLHSAKKNQTEISTLTDLEAEITIIATHPEETGLSCTRSGKNYVKDYSKVGPCKYIEIYRELSAKQKELHLQKNSKQLTQFWLVKIIESNLSTTRALGSQSDPDLGRAQQVVPDFE